MNNIYPFGIAPSGESVFLIKLHNSQLSCEIITFGATVRSLVVPDRNGDPVDVVLGYDTLQEYIQNDGYLGATVGRYANRIAGGRFSLNGSAYCLATNNGPNHLHGGDAGFSHRAWQIVCSDEASVTLSLFSPDGEEGYPGNLRCTVSFSLEHNGLVIRHYAQTDQDTPCSLTNHSYFNLAGHDAGTVLDQWVQINAQSYTPSNTVSIPTGEIALVKDTPMDMQAQSAIGLRIQDSFHQLINANGYDHNYVVNGKPGTLRPAAKGYAPATGITMDVETTLPGIQFYTANYLPQGRVGKGGCVYGPRHGFCLETQFFPDTPNQPNFPSAILRAGEEYEHCTVFCFTR